MIKRIITGGCSFSDQWTETSWIYSLQNKLKESYPDVTFNHTGFGSQGNELIQKKMSLALFEDLQTYKPDEILMLPMWSGTERKAFWIDNKDMIQEIAESWPKLGIFGNLQFHDLHSQANHDNIKIVNAGEMDGFPKNTRYNTEGGWYHCNFVMPDSKLSIEYFKSCETLIGFATVSLENIIFLQNLCKVQGVKILQSFYRSYVLEDIEKHKDHLNINYLYNLWDKETLISTTGIYEYLRPYPVEDSNYPGPPMPYKNLFRHIWRTGSYEDETKKYFLSDNWHPSKLGSDKWVDEVLFPKLQKENIFQ